MLTSFSSPYISDDGDFSSEVSTRKTTALLSSAIDFAITFISTFDIFISLFLIDKEEEVIIPSQVFKIFGSQPAAYTQSYNAKIHYNNKM